MAGSGVKISLGLSGFEEFQVALGGARFQKILEKHVGRATGRGAKLLEREVRQAVKDGNFTKNMALTIALKGSTKPLVDKGDLWKAITSTQTSWRSAQVGVSYKHEQYDLAEVLHNGADIPVSDKMRSLFFHLWLASDYEKDPRHKSKPKLIGKRANYLFSIFKDWRPLKATTRVIRIPGRPFLAEGANRPGIKAQVMKAWEDAVRDAFTEAAQ